MNFSCENARPLLAGYLDGELSQEQAAPLREHLLDCLDCREGAKDAKVLRRWFVDEEAPRAPEGFAARIARRAFAGDPGRSGVLIPEAPVASADLGTGSGAEATTGRGRMLPFLLTASTVAAGLLLCFAVAIQRRGLPESDDLRADTPAPWERAEASPALPTGRLPRPNAVGLGASRRSALTPAAPLTPSADGAPAESGPASETQEHEHGDEPKEPSGS